MIQSGPFGASSATRVPLPAPLASSPRPSSCRLALDVGERHPAVPEHGEGLVPELVRRVLISSPDVGVNDGNDTCAIDTNVRSPLA